MMPDSHNIIDTSLEVLYEDNHLIIVNKGTSDLVQGDRTGDVTLPDRVKQYLKDAYAKAGNVFLGVTHRLDRPVSGAVAFAKTSKALARMNTMFAEHQVEKIYWAIVCGCPKEEEGTLEHYLVRDGQKNKSFAHDKMVKDAKRAVLHYRTLAKGDRYTLLEVRLETGRHHQIRCQLATIGCPIKGDLKYGSPRSNPDGGIDLHARSLRFIHPVSKKEIYITAPVPNSNLWQVLTKDIVGN
ncbi:MAG: RluA family pseudouridine synthase [Bacteroidales bacterium]|nr:RluA family pseudouridine synthase [Bacteroidales bacterium]